MKKIFLILSLILFLFSTRLIAAQLQDEEDDLIVEDIEEEKEDIGEEPQIDFKSLIQTQPDEQFISGDLIVNKQLIAGTWHVACDVMGDQAWVKDEISNPKGIPSKEGHRLAFCGDPAHWIIWLNKQGKPFMLQEIKSGATGGTLNTKIYTDDTYTTEMSIYNIKPNERIYWTTFHNGQVWHHTGITRPVIPEFTFVINQVEYYISPGEELRLEDLPLGEYEIIEKYDPDYFIADVSIPFTVNEQGDVIVKVEVGWGEESRVQFINEKITPDEPPIETQPVIIQTEPLQTETELIIIETEPQQTETETELVIIETETETEKQSETQTQTQIKLIQTQTQTELIIIQTEPQTTIETQIQIIETESKQTQTQTEKQSEPILPEQTEPKIKESESETELKQVLITEQEPPETENFQEETEEESQIEKISDSQEKKQEFQEYFQNTPLKNKNVINNKFGIKGASREKQKKKKETETEEKTTQKIKIVVSQTTKQTEEKVIKRQTQIPSSEASVTVPQTGDNTPIIILLLIFMFSGLTAFLSYVLLKDI